MRGSSRYSLHKRVKLVSEESQCCMQALLETQASRVPQEQLDSLDSPEPQASLVCSSMHADAKSYLFSGCCALHTSTLFFQQCLSERVRALKNSLEETLHDSWDRSCHRSFGCHWFHWKYRRHRIYRCYRILWGHRCSIPPRCSVNCRNLKINLYIFFQVE